MQRVTLACCILGNDISPIPEASLNGNDECYYECEFRVGIIIANLIVTLRLQRCPITAKELAEIRKPVLIIQVRLSTLLFYTLL